MSLITACRPSSTTATAAADVPPLLDVVGLDLEVPLVTGGTRRLTHLDHAASAPALRLVADAITDALPWYASVHRGAGFTSTVCSAALDGARHDIARFVGARHDDVVVFTRNTTDALNLLAHALPAGTTVLTLDLEHHANLLPWRRGAVVHLATPSRIDQVADTFARALAEVRTDHALIAVTGASNVTGEVLPLAELAAVARRFGARVVVDAAQLAPHRAIDLDALGIDWLVFSGHKLNAPFGAGALVGRADWLDAAPPYLAGGGAVGTVGLHDAEWAASPARHEAGTPNVLGAIAIGAACRALAAVGLDRVTEHDLVLTERLLDGLATFDGVDVLAAFGPSSDRVAIATIVTERPSALVAAALSAEHGIATRDGAFCAHPLLRRLVTDPADPTVPNAVRASLGVSSSSADIDAFLTALEDVLVTGPRWKYALDRGRLVPTPDPRPRPTLGTNVTPGPWSCHR